MTLIPLKINFSLSISEGLITDQNRACTIVMETQLL